MRFRSRNHEIAAKQRRLARSRLMTESFAEASSAGFAAEPADKRTLIFEAVAAQLEQDNKRPFALSQKLNDAPYRYTRDTLWAALNSISQSLDEGTPRLLFPTEDDYVGEGDFSGFVNGCVTGTVSALINAIMDASRWPK
jgi:hypothetical protein